MTRSALKISILAVTTALSAFSAADDLTFVGLDYSGTLTGHVTFFNSVTNSNQSADVYIGKLLFQSGGNQIATVCGDLSSVLDSGAHTYAVSQTDPLAGTPLSAAGNIVAADFNSANNAHDGAALQLAVWSALYNGGATFDAGGSGFSVTGVDDSVLQQAAIYYQDFNHAGSATYYQFPGGGGGQSQLTASPAPEPASVAALGIGIAGIIARRRRARA